MDYQRTKDDLAIMALKDTDAVKTVQRDLATAGAQGEGNVKSVMRSTVAATITTTTPDSLLF